MAPRSNLGSWEDVIIRHVQLYIELCSVDSQYPTFSSASLRACVRRLVARFQLVSGIDE